MLQEVKKIFLAGVGAAVMTYDKALEIIEQLSDLVGDPDADFSSFSLDFPPADNFLEIEL